MMTKIAVVALVVVIVAVIVAVVAMRRATEDIPKNTAEDVAEFNRLVANGIRARATILSIEETGTIVNRVSVLSAVRFRLEPLDGSRSREGEKKLLLHPARMPRVGDIWLGWIDPGDSSKFEVSAPDFADPGESRTLVEFGISNPIAPPGGDSSDDRLEALERLQALRESGALSDDEFESEKRRLLE